MDSELGEASWCSQCGFTRRTAERMMQERQLQQQLLAEDEQLAALLSKNMWLSESQAQAQALQQQQQQPPRPGAAAPASASASAVATPSANISISQHYHHYHPTAPPPAPAPTEPTPTISPSTPPPTYIQHLLTTSPNPEAALQDYHRQLSLMEEQYHYHHRLHQQQSQTQCPPSPTGSTVSSIQDDHTLQMILLEQHNLAQEAEKLRRTRAQEEEQMIFNQLMMDTTCGVGDLMSDIVHQQQQMQSMDMTGQKVVYPGAPGQPWVATEEDIYGMDDEDSPCSIYYSRVATFL
ncbi:hypothetical protein L211DRAFT_837266 [Terfezia boudieri ATCC MYA-4762]|uniref:Uncharacterized protein n=1 Tax=Terfezia boudieri ATCC MYA-4762 TaxID=1051890 RepID=A0A3N4LT62_9PEZI|nr:hypothetical protein L211DRAFT_837266 [Terfezia boudieri ATCC MYA-4762]